MTPQAAGWHPQSGTGWLVDRENALLAALIFTLGFTYPLLPLGLVFDPVAREAMTVSDGSGSSFKLMWLPLMLLSVYLMWRRARWTMVMLPQVNVWLLILSTWVLLSSLWAPDSAAAFRQGVSINIPTLVALAFCVSAWSPERFLRLLMIPMSLLLIASLLVGVLAPAIGIHDSTQFELAGAWRGVTYQKNGLGQLASIGMIFWVWAWASGRVRMALAAANMALALFLVLASRSSTSLLMSVIGSSIIIMLLRSPLRFGAYAQPARWALALVVVVLLFSYMVLAGGVDISNLGQSFGALFGKDVTFSGRTFVWAELLREIPRHPLMGIGFNSFWGGPGSPSDEAIRRLGWPCPHGHNGYLDMINEIGFIGFALFVLFAVRHGSDLKRLARIYPDHAALHIGLFVYLMMANLTESGWFKPIQFTHVVAVYSSLTVSRLLMEARLQAVSGTAATPPPVQQEPQRALPAPRLEPAASPNPELTGHLK